MPQLTREVPRYLLVGVSNTVVSMALYVVMLALGVWYVAAVTVAYAGGLINGYTLNRRWTFDVGRSSIRSLSRYTTVQAAGLLASIGLSVLLVESFHVPKVAALAMTWPLVTAATFAATHTWAFGRAGN